MKALRIPLCSWENLSSALRLPSISLVKIPAAKNVGMAGGCLNAKAEAMHFGETHRSVQWAAVRYENGHAHLSWTAQQKQSTVARSSTWSVRPRSGADAGHPYHACNVERAGRKATGTLSLEGGRNHSCPSPNRKPGLRLTVVPTDGSLHRCDSAKQAGAVPENHRGRGRRLHYRSARLNLTPGFGRQFSAADFQSIAPGGPE